MAGTLIATLAVIGLAYSFGVGRGLINRYKVTRVALGTATYLMDSLATVAPANLGGSSLPNTHTMDFSIGGERVGTTTITVNWRDAASDGLGLAVDPDTLDIKSASVSISWPLSDDRNKVSLQRAFLGR